MNLGPLSPSNSLYSVSRPTFCSFSLFFFPSLFFFSSCPFSFSCNCLYSSSLFSSSLTFPFRSLFYFLTPSFPLPSQSILVEPQFSSVFLNLLLGRTNQLDDLQHLDAPMHRSLMAMKHAAARGEDISSWGIGFEVSGSVRSWGGVERCVVSCSVVLCCSGVEWIGVK